MVACHYLCETNADARKLFDMSSILVCRPHTCTKTTHCPLLFMFVLIKRWWTHFLTLWEPCEKIDFYIFQRNFNVRKIHENATAKSLWFDEKNCMKNGKEKSWNYNSFALFDRWPLQFHVKNYEFFLTENGLLLQCEQMRNVRSELIFYF